MDNFESFTAIRADIRRLEDKTDSLGNHLDAKIDSATARLAKEIVATQAGMREMKETMATKKDMDRILTAVQDFAGKAQNYDRVAVLHGRALTDTEVTLIDHEKRLRTIEGRAV